MPRPKRNARRTGGKNGAGDQPAPTINDSFQMSEVQTALNESMSQTQKSVKRPTPEDDESVTPRVTVSQNAYDPFDAEDAPQEVGERKPEGGTINRLRLVNFMSHLNFEWSSSGKPINFLCGRNGSGKSAILQAVVLAFNGGHTRSGKGGNNSQYIHDDKDTSLVELEINNDCAKPYLPEKYGSKILIRVELNRFEDDKGLKRCKTVWQTRNQAGKVITTNPKAVVEIDKFYKVSIKNPIVVLSQEVAKTFVHDYDAKKMYSLFEKTTSIEEIESALHRDRASIEEVTKIIEESKRLEQRLRQKREDWKDKMNCRLNADENERDLPVLKNEQKWAHVVMEEQEVEGYEKQWRGVEEHNKQLEMEMRQRETEIEELDAQIQDVQVELTKRNNEKNEIKDTLKVMSKRKEELIAEAEGTCYRDDVTKTDIENRKKTLKTLKEQLYHHSSEIAAEEKIEAVKTQYETQRDEAKRQQTAVTREADAAWEEMDSMHAKITLKEKEETTARAEVLRLKNAADSKKKRIENLKNHGRQNGGKMTAAQKCMAKFVAGADINITKWEELMKLVKKAEFEFKDKPIGPIANHIGMKEKHNKTWSKIMEAYMLTESVVTAWICTNTNDSIKLANLFREAKLKRPIIYVMKKTKKAIKPDHPEAGRCDLFNRINADKELTIAFDVLEINDAQVNNCLLQYTKLNAYVLSRNAEKAKLYSKQLRGGQRIYTSTYQMFSRYSAVSLRENDMIPHTRFINVDHTAVIEARKARLAKDEALMEEADAHHKLVKAELEQLKVERQSYVGKHQNCTQQIKEMAADIAGYSTQLALLSNQNAKNMKVERLRKEINEAQQALTLARQRLGIDQCAEQQAIKEFEEMQIKPLKDRMNQITMEINGWYDEERKQNELGINDEISALRKKQLALQAKNRKYNTQKSFSTRASKEKVAEEKFEKARDSLVSSIADAEDHGDRPEFIRPYPWLEDEIQRIEREISAEGGARDLTMAQIQKEHDVFQQKYRKVKLQLHQKRKTKHNLAKSLNRLELYLQSEKKTYSTRCKAAFRHFCERGGFQGGLDINHAAKHYDEQLGKMVYDSAGAISFTIKPQGQKTDVDEKGLSGGERSFVTVCFIVTLWFMIDTPFKFLDEFDVFMDVKNRELAVNLLYEACDLPKNRGKQYFLLTPNDISSRQVIPNFAPDKCTVFKLKDPKRNQVNGENAGGDQQLPILNE